MSRRIAAGLALVAGAALWVLAAQALLQTTVPDDLRLPSTPAIRYFTAAQLSDSSSYERFLEINGILSGIALVAALAVYARHGHRFTRESAAGRIGTGMLLGMLGFAFVWLAQLPFEIAQLWWERRHGVADQDYVTFVVDDFLALGGTFIFISVALVIVMALARPLPRTWWAPGAAVFVALTLLLALVSPYLLPDVHPLRNPSLAADAARLARAEGVADTEVSVQRVRRFTDEPNAGALGLGPTRRVVLWDTLLDDRFSRPELRAVMAHEFAHVARSHILRDIGFFALFSLPTALVIFAVTRRRGGMARPEAVPVALLALVLLQLAASPLNNSFSRRLESEADWRALETTRDPKAAIALFRDLGLSARQRPDPPGWIVTLSHSHPPIMDRIRMAEAWEAATR